MWKAQKRKKKKRKKEQRRAGRKGRRGKEKRGIKGRHEGGKKRKRKKEKEGKEKKNYLLSNLSEIIAFDILVYIISNMYYVSLKYSKTMQCTYSFVVCFFFRYNRIMNMTFPVSLVNFFTFLKK